VASAVILTYLLTRCEKMSRGTLSRTKGWFLFATLFCARWIGRVARPDRFDYRAELRETDSPILNELRLHRGYDLRLINVGFLARRAKSARQVYKLVIGPGPSASLHTNRLVSPTPKSLWTAPHLNIAPSRQSGAPRTQRIKHYWKNKC